MPRKGRPARRSSPPIQDSPCLRSKRSPRGVLHVETSQRDATSAAFDMSTLPAEPGDEHRRIARSLGHLSAYVQENSVENASSQRKAIHLHLLGLKAVCPAKGKLHSSCWPRESQLQHPLPVKCPPAMWPTQLFLSSTSKMHWSLRKQLLNFLNQAWQFRITLRRI